VRYTDPNAMGQAVIAGAADAGIRLTLLDTCYLSSGPDGAALTGAQLRFGDGTGEQWAERVEALRQLVGAQQTVMIGAALHSVRGVPVEHMPVVVKWADAQGVPLHVHSSEQIREVEQCVATNGQTPTAVLRDVGALGPRTTVVHATHLTSEDIADLDRTSTGVCFCPTTERDLGDGVGPAAALLAGSGLFSLGSDSHAVIDLFEEARAVELNERLSSHTRGTIAADRLLRSATYDGHCTLGWADVGQLAVGARADLVAVQLDSVRTTGGGATVENVVFAAAASDVTDVVVDGRPVVVDRRHVNVPEVEAELATAIGDLMDSR
jgi:formiminoglutamate deiminase